MLGKKILLIDSDPEFRDLIGLIFKEAGAQIFLARDGLEGMGHLFTQQPNLIVLNVMLPGQDGFQICRRIRQFSKTPLIMISSLPQDQLMVRGLEAGADDFLSQPINPEILLARSRTLMRRSRQKNGTPESISYDDGRLVIDFEKHRVLIEKNEIKLTPVEFRLLAYLVTNQDRALTYEQILFNVWGNEYTGNDDYVHVYISYLRSKIEPDPKEPSYIQSIHGVGYIFQKQKFGEDFSQRRLTKHSAVIEGSV